MATQGGIGFVCIFIILAIIQPPFIMKKEKDSTYKKVMWKVVFMLSLFGGILIAVLPRYYKI